MKTTASRIVGNAVGFKKMNGAGRARQSLRPDGDSLRYPNLIRFQAEAHRLVDAGTRSLVIDLALVGEMDVSAIGALVRIHRVLRQKGGELRLTGARPWIRSMLRMSGIDRIVRVEAPQPSPFASVKMPDAHTGLDAPGDLGALATA